MNCGCVCRCKAQPNHFFYYPKDAVFKILCDDHKHISSLKMDSKQLRENMEMIYHFFTEFTSKVIEVINGYQQQIIRSCISYEEVSTEFYNQNKSEEQMKQYLSTLQFPLGTRQINAILEDQRVIAKHICELVCNLANNCQINYITESDHMKLSQDSVHHTNLFVLKQSKKTDSTAPSSSMDLSNEKRINGIDNQESMNYESPLKKQGPAMSSIN